MPTIVILELENTGTRTAQSAIIYGVKYLMRQRMKYGFTVRSLALSLSILASAACGYATANESDAAQVDQPAKSDGTDKLVCKSEPVIGSNIKKKTCKTQKQVDEEREASQSSMGELSRQQGRGSGGS